jgi:nitric oxide reductase large subunit
VTSTDGQPQDLAAGGTARPGGAAPIVIALTAAIAFGAVDQYLPVAISKSSHLGAYLFVVEISKMSAPWLLVPFLAGECQGSQRSAALVGLAATWLAVLAYVLMIVSPMEGVHLTPRAFAFSLASQ